MIENSLDRGIVGLPRQALTYPQITQRQAQTPKLEKTPYTEQIESLDTFFEEVVNSDIAKRGTEKFADAIVKEKLLTWYLD